MTGQWHHMKTECPNTCRLIWSDSASNVPVYSILYDVPGSRATCTMQCRMSCLTYLWKVEHHTDVHFFQHTRDKFSSKCPLTSEIFSKNYDPVCFTVMCECREPECWEIHVHDIKSYLFKRLNHHSPSMLAHIKWRHRHRGDPQDRKSVV